MCDKQSYLYEHMSTLKSIRSLQEAQHSLQYTPIYADASILKAYVSFLSDEVSLFVFQLTGKFLHEVPDKQKVRGTFVCTPRSLQFCWNDIPVIEIFPPVVHNNNLLLQYARLYEGDLQTIH